MLKIGLTGGIGTGKTEVSNILQTLGATVIDADEVAHSFYAPGMPVWQEIVDEFGESVLCANGEIDRAKLAGIVFADEKFLSRLNEIVHPKTRSEIERRLQLMVEGGKKVVVIEIPLLVESILNGNSWGLIFDEIWVMSSDKKKVIQRVMNRNQLNEDSVLSRIDSQVSQKMRLSYADVVIDNEGTLAQLKQKVTSLWHQKIHELNR